MKNLSQYFTLAVVSLAVALGCLSGCGMIKNLQEMHDSTEHLSKGTDKMAATLDAAHNKGSQGGAASLRDAKLRSLNESVEVAAKMSHAAIFYEAFEFQIWDPKVESEKKRQNLMTDAVKEFFRVVNEYITDRNMIAPTAEDNKTQNLYAMVAALHSVNESQLTAIEGTGFREVTLLGMIEEGLRVKEKLVKGEVKEEELPPYQLEVLRKEQDAVYVLQVRQNFLKAFGFVLARSDMMGDEPSKLDLVSQVIKEKFGRTWIPNFDYRNPAQINYNAMVFEYAAETKNFLNEMFKMNKKLKQKNAEIYEPNNFSMITGFLSFMNLDGFNAKADTADGAAVLRFKNALNEVLK